MSKLKENKGPRFTGGDSFTDIKKIYHEIMMKNELAGGYSAYKLSYAGKGCGPSFGSNQLDIAHNQKAREELLNIIKNLKNERDENYFSDTEIDKANSILTLKIQELKASEKVFGEILLSKILNILRESITIDLKENFQINIETVIANITKVLSEEQENIKSSSTDDLINDLNIKIINKVRKILTDNINKFPSQSEIQKQLEIISKESSEISSSLDSFVKSIKTLPSSIYQTTEGTINDFLISFRELESFTTDLIQEENIEKLINEIINIMLSVINLDIDGLKAPPLEVFGEELCKKINEAFITPAGIKMINEIYIKEIELRADFIEEKIKTITNQAGRSFYDTNLGRALLFDYNNQYSPVTNQALIDYINNKVTREKHLTKAKISAPTDIYTYEHHRAFVETTAYYYNQQKAFEQGERSINDCIRRLNNVLIVIEGSPKNKFVNEDRSKQLTR